MKKITFLLISTFILKISVSGQAFGWAKNLQITYPHVGYCIFEDTVLYVTGNFSGTVDFDPGEAIYNLTAVGSQDIFILKISQSGNLIWVKTFGGGELFGFSAIDAAGNIYTTGSFSGTVDFDPGPEEYLLSSTSKIFIQKLDAGGNFIWAKKIGGNGSDMARDIFLDDESNIYLTGNFEGDIYFDPNNYENFLTSIGSKDIFIVKFDNNGNFIWDKSVGSDDYDLGNQISVDSDGNVIILGVFQSTVDFDPGESIYDLSSLGAFDIFILKLDNEGNFVWAKSIGNEGNDAHFESYDLDNDGNINITGCFAGTMDFDPGLGIFNLNSVGVNDIFILKLNSQGDFVWAKSFGGTSDDYGHSVASDSNGNIYLSGTFQGSGDFDPGTEIFELSGWGSQQSIYFVKLDNEGEFMWALSICDGSLGDTGSNFFSMEMDNFGNIYATGNYYGTADFDPGEGVFSMSGGMFILKLIPSTSDIDHYSNFKYSVFPNPSNGNFTIYLNEECKNSTLILTDFYGRQLFKQSINNTMDRINFQLPVGLFFITIFSGNTNNTSKLIVK